MQLHNLKPQHPRRRQKLIGRGGKRGTTAGRGTKGQRARAGHRIRPEIRDVIKRLPKKRGYRFYSRPDKIATVTLVNLVRHFGTGETVSPTTLAARRLISVGALRHGRVKIIGAANLIHALIVQGCLITLSARKVIEAAGGKYVE